MTLLLHTDVMLWPCPTKSLVCAPKTHTTSSTTLSLHWLYLGGVSVLTDCFSSSPCASDQGCVFFFFSDYTREALGFPSGSLLDTIPQAPHLPCKYFPSPGTSRSQTRALNPLHMCHVHFSSFCPSIRAFWGKNSDTVQEYMKYATLLLGTTEITESPQVLSYLACAKGCQRGWVPAVWL